MKRIEYLIEKFDEISDKIGKHNVMLIAFIVIVLLITSIYSTFSLFTSSEGPEVIGGLTTYKFILNSELSDTSIIVPANTDKNLDIVVNNNEDMAMLYGIYYSATGSVTIGYTTNTSNATSGMIEANGIYTISLKVSNSTNNNITVDLGVAYGFESGGDLALPSGAVLIDKMYPIKLSKVAVGSYVSYSGKNGCPDGHCDGTNANYVEGSTMGYCAASSYPFASSGWRVGYIQDGSVHLISAGAPECMCTNEDGTTSSDVCDTYDTSVGLSQHLGNLDSKALTYCNSKYVYAGVCDNTTTWSFNPNDFRNITGSGMYYNSSDDISCLNGNGDNCGSGNDLIDNGSYYWINGAVDEGSLTMSMHWFPYFHYATYNDSTFTYGVRPVVKIDPAVVVTEGSGTYEDPYVISNPQFPSNVFADEVMAPNAVSDADIDFSVVSSSSGTNGIYIKNETYDDLYPIYYYRGNVNNNLIFADTCWKVVRTTETGGLKLIYNGLPSSGQCNNTGSASQIGLKKFNSSSDSPGYVGYMYSTIYTYNSKSMSSITDAYVYGNDVTYTGGQYTLTDTITSSDWSSIYNGGLNNNHYTCFSTSGTCTDVYYVYYTSISYAYYIKLTGGKKVEDALTEMLGADDGNTDSYNTMSSTIKGNNTTSGTLDYWYYTNIDQKGYSGYIEDTVWCNDRTIWKKNGWDPDGGSTTAFLLFGVRERVESTYKPSLACERNIDSFTVNEANGNGDLDYPVGLLTGDEIMLAGGKKGTSSNLSYYLYTGETYWAGTPSESTVNNAYEFIVSSSGILDPSSSVGSTYGVRPSVSLKPGFSISGGKGTAESPYIVP